MGEVEERLRRDHPPRDDQEHRRRHRRTACRGGNRRLRLGPPRRTRPACSTLGVLDAHLGLPDAATPEEGQEGRSPLGGLSPIELLGDFEPEYGRAVRVAPGLRRVVAQNPSKFTAWGTGTYLIGDGRVAIVDPGPALDEHVDALLRAVEGETVTHVLITHTHADHSPATAAIVAATGATTYGFGPHPTDEAPGANAAGAGPAGVRSAEPAGTDDGTAEGAEGAVQPAADAEQSPTVEEHGDLTFVPDVVVRHGDVLQTDAGAIECLHTPGHISNHICYSWAEGAALFSGDHVMGWSTSVISPPDGRITDYLDSLRLLLGRDEAVYYPTHGSPISDPRTHVRALLEHRLERERQIVELLGDGPRTVPELVAVMYADVRPELHEPAGRSVTAHLIALAEAGRVTGPTDDGAYRLR